MTPLQMALKYLDIFFAGDDYEPLYQLFAEDLEFDGPFYYFNSAEDYIESLRSDPPEDCTYKLIQTFENGPFVNLIYEFVRDEFMHTPMSQLFEVRDGRITKILLIFDASQII